ncbi:hypothetical protein HNO88_002862 [Novosphingobium chloroacetimidivorans]|uniref:Uncharacterized protein n=1 Tax=Novosphingobium chloroacetimidivorans TaxID=1428314 RepID=A0A7W7KCH1_9SPHN|nr:hypothetical protein [Novosphingobium chloroacetimidivorans]MBB4859533.1 hypothetical protein [Novosphingobium chloroacetimidivorans]
MRSKPLDPPVMTPSRALVLFRLWAALLLATIGLQALEPVVTPLQRAPGSAFSAATADVALASSRRAEIAQPQALPTPALPRFPAPVSHASVPTMLPRAKHLLPLARGPPPRERSERVPDPRGPPPA